MIFVHVKRMLEIEVPHGSITAVRGNARGLETTKATKTNKIAYTDAQGSHLDIWAEVQYQNGATLLNLG